MNWLRLRAAGGVMSVLLLPGCHFAEVHIVSSAIQAPARWPCSRLIRTDAKAERVDLVVRARAGLKRARAARTYGGIAVAGSPEHHPPDDRGTGRHRPAAAEAPQDAA